MGKRLAVVVMVGLIVLTIVTSAGCVDKNKEAAKKAIVNAQKAITAAKVAGLTQQQLKSTQQKLDEAKALLNKKSVEAKQLAEEANALANKIKQDSLASAQAQVDNAISSAEQTIQVAIAGSDLSQAQQSLTKAKNLKSSAKDINELVGQTESAAYYANLAAQQVEAASAARQAQIAAERQAERTRQVANCKAVMIAYFRTQGGLTAVWKVWLENFEMNDACTAASATVWYQDTRDPSAATQPNEIRGHREGDTWIIDYLGTG